LKGKTPVANDFCLMQPPNELSTHWMKFIPRMNCHSWRICRSPWKNCHPERSERPAFCAENSLVPQVRAVRWR